MRRRIVEFSFFCVCLCEGSSALRAQEFKLLDRTVQFHGFVSQGFVYTDHNNLLTMNTSEGSGAFTDMGLNASTQLTDKFRIGAQVYDRNLGQLGQYHPSLDWAVADYRFKPWLGIRAGKVKTTLGLYNDTQDLDFIHTFALLPQSVYATDLRDATIAHVGGDIYGTVSFKHHLGEISYTGYAGHRSDSIYSGFAYLASEFQIHYSSYGGLQYGGDLRWETPLKGLLIGASRINSHITGKGNFSATETVVVPYLETSKKDWVNQFYGEYTRGRLRFDSEYRRYFRDHFVPTVELEDVMDIHGWYVSGAYRVNKRIEFGSYYSHYTITSVFGTVCVIRSERDGYQPAS